MSTRVQRRMLEVGTDVGEEHRPSSTLLRRISDARFELPVDEHGQSAFESRRIAWVAPAPQPHAEERCIPRLAQHRRTEDEGVCPLVIHGRGHPSHSTPAVFSAQPSTRSTRELASGPATHSTLLISWLCSRYTCSTCAASASVLRSSSSWSTTPASRRAAAAGGTAAESDSGEGMRACERRDARDAAMWLLGYPRVPCDG